jgi:hypothetical protein
LDYLKRAGVTCISEPLIGVVCDVLRRTREAAIHEE